MNAVRVKNWLGNTAGAAVVLALLVAAALLAPVIAPFDPLEQEQDRRLEPPSAVHLFGTDGFGRDVFSRTLYAARVTFAVALISVAVATAAGVVSGAASSLVGGSTDMLYQRLVDIVLGFPPIVLAIVIVVAMKPSPAAIGVAITATLTPRVVRVARASALVVSEQDYVTAARSVGVGRIKIVLRHILPGIRAPVLAQVSSSFGTAVITEATMSFLGLGVPPPYPSLGRMLQEGSRQYFEVAPWVTLFPGLVVAVSVTCFAVLADRTSDRRFAGRRVNSVPSGPADRIGRQV